MTDSPFEKEVLAAVPRNFVVSTELGDGLALLDLRTNVYFSLSEVGTVVWDALQAPTTRAGIVERVVSLYDVEPEVCAGDVDALLGDLLAAKLIDIQPPVEP